MTQEEKRARKAECRRQYMADPARKAAAAAKKREKYATDAEFREASKQCNVARTRVRLATDPEFRERQRESNRLSMARRRAEDPEYRAKTNAATRESLRKTRASMTDAERAEINAKRRATVDKEAHAARCREYRVRKKAERTNP